MTPHRTLASFRLALRAAFVAAALLVLPSFAQAGAEHNLAGFAWSSNIGWVSFNCIDIAGACASSNYGVNHNANGSLTGYAWSSNIGWIQFGGLSGFPSGNGTFSVNATTSSSGTGLVGWAKAIAADGNGWDGWISLSGTSPSYGVSISGSYYTGYAWGGPVVGWLSFDAAGANGVRRASDATLDVRVGGVSIVGNNSVPYNTIPTFVWTITNLPGGSTCGVSKTSSGGTAFTAVTGQTASGQTTGNALTDAAYTYRLLCTNGASTLVDKNVSFTVVPQPPGFTLGTTDTANIQFVVPNTAESESRAVFVYPVGGFSSPVTVTIGTYPTLPASTTMVYSFNGGTSYSSGPSAIISNFNQGFSFKVKVTRVSGAPVFSGPYTVTLRGAASGYPDATKDIIIKPTTFVPLYKEI